MKTNKLQKVFTGRHEPQSCGEVAGWGESIMEEVMKLVQTWRGTQETEGMGRDEEDEGEEGCCSFLCEIFFFFVRGWNREVVVMVGVGVRVGGVTETGSVQTHCSTGRDVTDCQLLLDMNRAGV